jgi:hypothetical protein
MAADAMNSTGDGFRPGPLGPAEKNRFERRFRSAGRQDRRSARYDSR